MRAAASLVLCKTLGIVTPDLDEVAIRELVFAENRAAKSLALTREFSVRIHGPFRIDGVSCLR